MAAAANTTNFGLCASRIALVTPSDGSLDLPFICNGVSFSAVGSLKVVTEGGDTVTIPSGALAAGVIHPLRLTQVYSTGTTVADLVIYA